MRDSKMLLLLAAAVVLIPGVCGRGNGNLLDDPSFEVSKSKDQFGLVFGMVQHALRRNDLWLHTLGQGLDRPEGGRFTVDMWPDVSEYAPDDLCDVPGLKLPDGSSARLYSAFRKGPVLLHTRWMRQYGIDGIFVSRFIGEAASPTRSRHVNKVLANLREGCHREGRVWAMMLYKRVQGHQS